MGDYTENNVVEITEWNSNCLFHCVAEFLVMLLNDKQDNIRAKNLLGIFNVAYSSANSSFKALSMREFMALLEMLPHPADRQKILGVALREFMPNSNYFERVYYDGKEGTVDIRNFISFAKVFSINFEPYYSNEKNIELMSADYCPSYLAGCGYTLKVLYDEKRHHFNLLLDDTAAVTSYKSGLFNISEWTIPETPQEIALWINNVWRPTYDSYNGDDGVQRDPEPHNEENSVESFQQVKSPADSLRERVDNIIVDYTNIKNRSDLSRLRNLLLNDKNTNPFERAEIISEVVNEIESAPYKNNVPLNFHKHSKIDWLISLRHTSAYKTFLTEVKLGLYEQLVESAAQLSRDQQIRLWNEAKQLSIFATHRSNLFFFRGGKTKTVQAIERQLNEARQAAPNL